MMVLLDLLLFFGQNSSIALQPRAQNLPLDEKEQLQRAQTKPFIAAERTRLCEASKANSQKRTYD
jgi:hypothetical protein